MNKYEKGEIVKGVVTGIEDYGIFVSFDEYYSGLIHISEISHGFVKNIFDYINVGEFIYTEILDIDHEEYHLKLSIKNIDYKENKVSKRKKIKETGKGFELLAQNLPYWIEENLKNNKKVYNNVDK